MIIEPLFSFLGGHTMDILIVLNLKMYLHCNLTLTQSKEVVLNVLKTKNDDKEKEVFISNIPPGSWIYDVDSDLVFSNFRSVIDVGSNGFYESSKFIFDSKSFIGFYKGESHAKHNFSSWSDILDDGNN